MSVFSPHHSIDAQRYLVVLRNESNFDKLRGVCFLVEDVF
jgi:hypothetical protein